MAWVSRRCKPAKVCGRFGVQIRGALRLVGKSAHNVRWWFDVGEGRVDGAGAAGLEDL